MTAVGLDMIQADRFTDIAGRLMWQVNQGHLAGWTYSNDSRLWQLIYTDGSKSPWKTDAAVLQTLEVLER